MHLTKIRIHSLNIPKFLKRRTVFTQNVCPALIKVPQSHFKPVEKNVRLCVQPKFRHFTVQAEPLVDPVTFEKVCEETLESLSEFFEQLAEDSDKLKTADISYSGGVLTANLGDTFGTYVINRQSPNRQIWLSSPTSGPKRYDFAVKDGCWVYRHTGETLHKLLQEELSRITGSNVDLSALSYSKL